MAPLNKGQRAIKKIRGKRAEWSLDKDGLTTIKEKERKKKSNGCVLKE
jgi:hypothetical protein